MPGPIPLALSQRVIARLIAKNAKAGKKISRADYRSPIICPRVYKQVAATLDPNRNGVACESR